MDILNLARTAGSCSLCKIQESLHWLQLLAVDLGLPRQEPEIWRVCTFCLLAISATWRSWRAFAEVCRLKSGPFCQIFVCRPQKRAQVSAFATLLSVRGRFSVTQQPLAFSSNNMLTIVFQHLLVLIQSKELSRHGACFYAKNPADLQPW